MTYSFYEIFDQGLVIAPKTGKPYTNIKRLRIYLNKNGFKLKYIKKENMMRYVLTDKDIKKLNNKAKMKFSVKKTIKLVGDVVKKLSEE